MSRILKRPMFKTGGSTNSGIMTGLVDRKNYNLGTRTEEIVAAMDKYAPIPKSRFPMGQIGLNLVSGEYAGDGLLSNIAGSAKGPYSQWTAADDARAQALAQRKASAVGVAISEGHAEKMARLKAAGETKMQKDYTTGRKKFELKKQYTEDPKNKYDKTIYKIYPDVMANYGSYIEDNAMSTEEGRKFLRQVDGVVEH